MTTTTSGGKSSFLDSNGLLCFRRLLFLISFAISIVRTTQLILDVASHENRYRNKNENAKDEARKKKTSKKKGKRNRLDAAGNRRRKTHLISWPKTKEKEKMRYSKQKSRKLQPLTAIFAGPLPVAFAWGGGRARRRQRKQEKEHADDDDDDADERKRAMHHHRLILVQSKQKCFLLFESKSPRRARVVVFKGRVTGGEVTRPW